MRRRRFGRSAPEPIDLDPQPVPAVEDAAPAVVTVDPVTAAPPTFGPPARRPLPTLTATPAGVGPLPSAADVPGAIVGALENFLEAVADVPAPSVVVVHITPRTVGLGGLRGLEHRGPFADVELHGGRVEAVVRFLVWGADAGAANQEMLALQGRLLAAQSDLAIGGFVEMGGVAGSLAAEDQNAWGRTADYRVLFEYELAPAAQAQGLIARILVADLAEETDELVRWDNAAAPALVLRGRRALDRLTVLSTLPGPAPIGTVTVLRTSDEAAGSPVAHGDLHDFLVAVGDPTAPEAHATFTFDTVADFLAAFTDTGEDLLLGGGDGGELPHNYLAGELSLTPAIPLPRAGDRVEIALGVSSFAQDNEAVVYLRAAGTLG